MSKFKTVMIGFPPSKAKEFAELAGEEDQNIVDFITEAVRQYTARKRFRRLVKKGTALAKKKGLKPEDFGGPF